jgi:hypothetical protein
MTCLENYNKVLSLSHSIGLSCGAKGRVKESSMLLLRIMPLRDFATFHRILHLVTDDAFIKMGAK